jgi:hypothetical protein
VSIVRHPRAERDEMHTRGVVDRTVAPAARA